MLFAYQTGVYAAFIWIGFAAASQLMHAVFRIPCEHDPVVIYLADSACQSLVSGRVVSRASCTGFIR